MANATALVYGMTETEVDMVVGPGLPRQTGNFRPDDYSILIDPFNVMPLNGKLIELRLWLVRDVSDDRPPGDLYLQVWRPTSESGLYQLVNQTSVEQVGPNLAAEERMSSFFTRYEWKQSLSLEVARGDVVGFHALEYPSRYVGLPFLSSCPGGQRLLISERLVDAKCSLMEEYFFSGHKTDGQTTTHCNLAYKLRLQTNLPSKGILTCIVLFSKVD